MESINPFLSLLLRTPSQIGRQLYETSFKNDNRYVLIVIKKIASPFCVCDLPNYTYHRVCTNMTQTMGAICWTEYAFSFRSIWNYPKFWVFLCYPVFSFLCCVWALLLFFFLSYVSLFFDFVEFGYPFCIFWLSLSYQ